MATRAAAMPVHSRTGRRPGTGDTRAEILAAARSAFGERGFERTTVRAVAAAAGVDPALVHHYFGTKQRLFLEAVELPIDFEATMGALLQGPRDRLGERLAGTVVDLWEQPVMRPLILALVRSAATDPTAATMLRNVLFRGPLSALLRAVEREDAELRGALIASQLIGYSMARYVVRLPALTSASREAVVAALGPTLQRYLTGDIG